MENINFVILLILLILLILFIWTLDKYHLFYSYNYGKMESSYDWIKLICFCLICPAIFLSSINYLGYFDNVPEYALITLYAITVLSLVYLFLNKFNCDIFSFSKMIPFSKTYNIHLSNPLLDKIKKMKRNQAESTSIREYLDKTTIKELTKELELCFENKKAKCIVMKSHHIGLKEQENRMIEHLSANGYITKRNSISIFEQYSMTIVLSIMLMNLKPLKWKVARLDIYHKNYDDLKQ